MAATRHKRVRARDEREWRQKKRTRLNSKVEMEERAEVTNGGASAMSLAHTITCKRCKFIKCCGLQPNVPGIEAMRPSPPHFRLLGKKPWFADAMLNPTHYIAAIRAIYKSLGMKLILPSVDCFACRRSAQPAVLLFINREQDFFSRRFGCEKFWADQVAWANPPFEDAVLKRTIDVFAERRMCGFVCGPRWPTDNDINMADRNEWLLYARRKSGYKTLRNIGGRGSKEFYFPEEYGYSDGGGNVCPFDTVVVFVDFRA